jgi:hypothetical protein
VRTVDQSWDPNLGCDGGMSVLFTTITPSATASVSKREWRSPGCSLLMPSRRARASYSDIRPASHTPRCTGAVHARRQSLAPTLKAC